MAQLSGAGQRFYNVMTQKYYPTMQEAQSAHLQPAASGSAASGSPQYGPNSPMALKAQLEKTRQEGIYGPLQAQTNIYGTRPYTQLTGQLQGRASGGHVPFDQSYIDARIGESSDAVNRQYQQGAQRIDRDMGRSGIGGGLVTSAQLGLQRAAGQQMRADRRDITSATRRDNFNATVGGQRDMMDWLRQRAGHQMAGTQALAGYKAQEHFYQNTPGGYGTSSPNVSNTDESGKIIPTGSVSYGHKGWQNKPKDPEPAALVPQEANPWAGYKPRLWPGGGGGGGGGNPQPQPQPQPQPGGFPGWPPAPLPEVDTSTPPWPKPKGIPGLGGSIGGGAGGGWSY